MAHERLNRIGRISQATSYLEIGIANGENFFNIDIKNKTAVDPAFLFDFEAKRDAQTSFCQMTSDSFFGQYKGSAFDLIYLDGLHTYDQTLRDFLGSLSVAHSKTIWLIDDTRPNDNFSALPDQQRCYSLRKKTGNDDWAWMGDVFKVVYFIAIAMKNYQYRTFTGRGQTIVWHDPSRFDHMPNLEIGDIPGLTFSDYLETHEAIFNLHDDERIFAELREFLER